MQGCDVPPPTQQSRLRLSVRCPANVMTMTLQLVAIAGRITLFEKALYRNMILKHSVWHIYTLTKNHRLVWWQKYDDVVEDQRPQVVLHLRKDHRLWVTKRSMATYNAMRNGNRCTMSGSGCSIVR